MSSIFDVWAPRAESLTLVADGTQYAMTQGEGGWWHPTDPPSSSDVAYGYLVNGAGQLVHALGLPA
jgi:maltooligosyltrehalose trehalohydrolase